LLLIGGSQVSNDGRLIPRATGFSVPTGPDWLHEVKYDGYRLRLERDGDRVRRVFECAAKNAGAGVWIGRRR
jgi:hypothetical protein